MNTGAPTIAAIINPASGSAERARSALDARTVFSVHDVKADAIESTVRRLVDEGAQRILVSGGDGTIAAAAQALAGTNTELALLPGGTLNHFASDLGISNDAAEALSLAETGSCKRVDIGMVNERVFLNTSSVGSYVHFVRLRESLEKRITYRFASAIAALRVLAEFRTIAVELEVDGKRRIYRTPLVFIGVGERELQLPTLGNRIEGGRSGLHVFVVRGRTRARLFALALNAVARGAKTAAKTPSLDSFIVDRCTIATKRQVTVSMDGELVRLKSPLCFELRAGALRVVCP